MECPESVVHADHKDESRYQSCHNILKHIMQSHLVAASTDNSSSRPQ